MKNTWFKLVFAFLFLSACSTEKQESVTFEEQSEVITTAQSQDSQKYFYINTPNNEQLANITIDGEKIQLGLVKGELFGELKREKRKYFTANNQMQFAVKLSDDGFKLRDANEELLWKVKLYDDKIKLADNEEMTDAFAIKLKENKLKIEQEGEEVETLRFNPNEQGVGLKDIYTLRNFGNSMAMGVLLLPKISKTAKFILCAEILKRGK